MEDESSEGYRISGILTENQYVINKFIGVNDAGEPRAIVFAVPTTTGAAYRRAADEAQRFWWVLVPVGGVATVLMLWAEVRIIRSATMPLSRAIAGYGEKREVHLERDAVATELRPVLDGFVALTDDLERSQAEKQRMIADISHDVKTPLTVIRGYAQAFRDGMVPPERTQAFAQALCDKAEIASNMVEALGTYAATEHPDYHAERVDCDLTAVLRTIAEGLEPTVVQHGGMFSYDIPEGPVPARLDVELLRRALTNLAVNACVHNDAGVAVAMRCHVRAISESGRVATLQVLDNGRGIDPALVEHVFDPFVTSNVAPQVGKGTGTGAFHRTPLCGAQRRHHRAGLRALALVHLLHDYAQGGRRIAVIGWMDGDRGPIHPRLKGWMICPVPVHPHRTIPRSIHPMAFAPFSDTRTPLFTNTSTDIVPCV